jgi:hypothetical protein
MRCTAWLFVPCRWQIWNKLLSSCNKVEEANKLLAISCSNKSSLHVISCFKQVDDNELLTTCYEQPVLVVKNNV